MEIIIKDSQKKTFGDLAVGDHFYVEDVEELYYVSLWSASRKLTTHRERVKYLKVAYESGEPCALSEDNRITPMDPSQEVLTDIEQSTPRTIRDLEKGDLFLLWDEEKEEPQRGSVFIKGEVCSRSYAATCRDLGSGDLTLMSFEPGMKAVKLKSRITVEL